MANRDLIGTYIKSSGTGGGYNAYMPSPLPPKPPLDMSGLYALLEQASVALGRLDGMSRTLPDYDLFLYMYVRKEAILSSQIEGTQSSLSDLLLFEHSEAPGVPMDDVTEVSCYVAAMNYGLRALQALPLSLRLIRETHTQLMNNARGGNSQPGQFRRVQNWLGGTGPENAHFVPPPPERLMECLDNFEKFLHNDKAKFPILIKAALAHVQFETIHPFLDGNGRLGRLLITFMLCAEGTLKEPLLYLSLYFKTHRQAYYAHLQSVRETGNWEAWVEFFLTGVIYTAHQATETAQNIVKLFADDKTRIERSGNATAASGVLRVHSYLQRKPISNITSICTQLKLSHPTITRHLSTLQKLGIAKEITGKPRRKIFTYVAYLAILNSGTEPL